MEKKKHQSLLPKHYKEIIKENPLTFLFQLINEYTAAHIEKEIGFFRKL